MQHYNTALSEVRVRIGDTVRLTRDELRGYFLRARTPRADWRVGMEIEKMGRNAETGEALPYDDAGPSVLRLLDCIEARRGGGSPIWEGEHRIGINGEWGTISLEPGGQVEWSSRPLASLDALADELHAHLAALEVCGKAIGARWVPYGVDPDLPVSRARWMPKARYGIMRPYLGARGRLAERMMAQTASIQCSFDYASEEDFQRKFKAATVLDPIAVALFANSQNAEGKPTGFQSFRQAIWRETDPARCGMPREMFEAGFTLDAWLDHVLRVPTMLLHRGRGLVPAGGVPFEELLLRTGCSAAQIADFETHLSTIFTEVRAYTYIEVRGADLQPDELAFAVPALWTGILYHEPALEAALALGQAVDDHEAWMSALDSASRTGLDGRYGDRPLREAARELVAIAASGLRSGAACAGSGRSAIEALARLAEHRSLDSKP